MLLLCLALLIPFGAVLPQQPTLGLFEKHSDIAVVLKSGSVEYDSTHGTYRVTGSGTNMWFGSDEFQFVRKQMSGDVSLAADIKWIGTGGNPHRKACLLIRQSLDPDAPYADAVLHGNGLTSLQYREDRGGPTREIQSNISAPGRLRIEKVGDYVSMSIANEGESFLPSGGSFRLKLTDPFFVGLGVCAHDSNAVETAVFSKVEITSGKQTNSAEQTVESTMETIDIASMDRRVVYHTRGLIEAPNWSRDGKYLLFNRDGKIYRLDIGSREPVLMNTDFAARCNNDHGISPDGKELAISDQSKDGKSRIYIVPIEGGVPRLVTPFAPSYWHGWSPDGKTVAYCAERNGEFDVYTIPVGGGNEMRLTSAPGLDDGPDYSPDGEYIYFNSERTGLMQIWRMKPDSSTQEQVTSDDYNNWFAHPSPDGKWIVFLSYEKDVKGHPANKGVMLRIMPVGGGQIQILARLFGGQGTINVPSWSPDSRSLAFVSYRLVNPQSRRNDNAR